MIRKLVCIVTFTCSVASGQSIQLGPEFMPRSAALHPADSLVVPAGETFTVTESATYHTIEVHGVLKFDRFAAVTLTVDTIQVMEGGVLDMGTPTDPVFAPIEIVIDAQPDLVNDPYQWTGGIVCLGDWYACGLPVQPWSTGPLPESVDDIESFRQSVTHDANRNIVIRSADPFGYRGHTAVTKHGYAEIYNTAFLGLGRTKNAPLDNTTPDHVGTNQVGRYVFHWHHNHPQKAPKGANGIFTGCYVDGLFQSKWGVVIHGSHFMAVTENTVEGINGAAIVTEDGNETNNIINRNLVIDTTGNGRHDRHNDSQSNPGAAGSGIWLRGLGNVVTDNIVMDSDVGIQYFNRIPKRSVFQQLAPLLPGAPNTEPVDYRNIGPLEAARNVTVNCKVGIETWNTPDALEVANETILGGDSGVKMGGGEPGSITINDSTILGPKNGVVSSAAYTTLVAMNRCYVAGCSKSAIRDSKQSQIVECEFKGNGVDVLLSQLPPVGMVIESCLLGSPTKLESYPFDRPHRKSYVSEGAKVRLIDWQQGGSDYFLVQQLQDRGNLADHATDVRSLTSGASPEAGITLGECFDKYGITLFGTVVDYQQAVTLDGVVGAKAMPGTFDVGPSRVVFTFPNVDTPPILEGASEIVFYVNTTGEPLTDGDVTPYQIDGVEHRPRHGHVQNTRITIRKSDWPDAFTTGTHEIRTWVEREGGVVPGSEITTYFHVGQSRPDPEPKPEPEPEPEPDDATAALIAQIQALIAQLQQLLKQLMGL